MTHRELLEEIQKLRKQKILLQEGYPSKQGNREYIQITNKILAVQTQLNRITDEHHREGIWAETVPPEHAVDPFEKEYNRRVTILSNKAKCLRCDVVIESKHRHDFVTCDCGSLSVDGGFDYIKRSFNFEYGFVELSTFEDKTND